MNRENPTILIVDDLLPNRIFLRGILEREGFKVFEASDGRQARHTAEEIVPDLILLDIRMPGEDGYESCTKLKKNPVTMDIPVIFLSSLEEVEEKVKAFDVGGVDYVTKPFEPAEMLVRVRLHIRMAQSRQALIDMQTSRMKQLSEAQQAILPRPEEYPEANFAVEYKPLMEAGGDFYDILPYSADIFGYVCADVSGHDIGSSLATAELKALLHQNSGPLYTPEETIRIINSVLINTLPEDVYLTLIFAHLNRRLRKLRVINAGHPPLIIQSAKGKTRQIDAMGDLVGMFPAVDLGITEVNLKEDERFFLYSDGLIERGGEPRMERTEGLKLLQAALEKHREKPIDKQIQSVLQSLNLDREQADDDLLLLGVQL